MLCCTSFRVKLKFHLLNRSNQGVCVCVCVCVCVRVCVGGPGGGLKRAFTATRAHLE